MSNPSNLIPGSAHRRQEASSADPCHACRTGTGLHSCEEFPLPRWALGYLRQWTPDLMPTDRDRLHRLVIETLANR